MGRTKTVIHNNKREPAKVAAVYELGRRVHGAHLKADIDRVLYLHSQKGKR